MKNVPWWLFKYLKEHKLLVVIAVITLILNAAITSYLAYFVKVVVNSVFVNKDPQMIKLIPLILIGLVFLKGIVFFANYYSMSYMGQKVITNLRQELYERIIRLPLEYFQKEPPGTFVSRVINDTSLLQDFTSRQVATFIRNLLTAIGLIGVVFYQDFKLAFIGFVGLPLIGYTISKIGKRIKRYTDRVQDKLAIITNHLFEGVKNIKEIKLFGLEGKFSGLFKLDNEKYLKDFMKIKLVEGIYPPLVEMTGALLVGFLIFYGGREVLLGHTTPGAFFSFIIALIMAYEPIRKLGQNYNRIQQSSAVAQRVKEILSLPDEYQIKDGKEELEEGISEIKFKDVSFSYPNSKRKALEGVNISFLKGKKYAIVGKSGSGKSTLVNFIPRFYEPTEGKVEVNGKDYRNYKLLPLRKRIGMVSQEIILFRGTVKENISIGKPEATLEEVVEAAKIANIHDFITSLPKGYDTLIGEGGIQLSGGQRQRIAIARAVLKDPDVLILDEATSALDSETERAIQKAIDERFRDRILITVAHRLSTVLNSDEIIFIKEGRVIGKGSHKELYSKIPDYKRLVDLQFSL
ncbi:ABC-type multidrug transport system fused ATPase/permease subunit [Thermovibrio guaymasensis]|uniref:ABC-type multidrug transport system fused ATPase/permease subunit n=1 Tax=Thermovibrio guaymasensis TaxID=240167 RepID=A0A420W839_9BACT|nr:ABC transporter ATP-binding protein [Thermovibrio guaymasensis]RKQ63490.1 ABC-type multidrug transport system fused ATPase/permease subunit [Thermovibrio guaymasensis]